MMMHGSSTCEADLKLITRGTHCSQIRPYLFCELHNGVVPLIGQRWRNDLQVEGEHICEARIVL